MYYFISKQIYYFTDCWASTPIMSTYAVSFLLLRKYRNGATLEQLAIDLSIMRNKMQQADKDIGFSGSSKNVVEHAVNICCKLFTFLLVLKVNFNVLAQSFVSQIGKI